MERTELEKQKLHQLLIRIQESKQELKRLQAMCAELQNDIENMSYNAGQIDGMLMEAAIIKE